MNETYKTLLVYGIVALLTWYAIKTFFKGVGLVKEADVEKGQKELQSNESPLNPQYLYSLRRDKNVESLRKGAPQILAKELKRLLGVEHIWTYANDSAVISLFKKLNNKVKVAQVALAYSKFGLDVQNDLEHLSAKNQAILSNYIQGLPIGYV